MSFEQDFPSLKDNIHIMDYKFRYIFEKDIQDSCLDKQRVREAFNKVELACEDDNYFAIIKSIENFKKELEL